MAEAIEPQREPGTESWETYLSKMNKHQQEETKVGILAENGVLLVNKEKSFLPKRFTLSNIKMRSVNKIKQNPLILATKRPYQKQRTAMRFKKKLNTYI